MLINGYTFVMHAWCHTYQTWILKILDNADKWLDLRYARLVQHTALKKYQKSSFYISGRIRNHIAIACLHESITVVAKNYECE